MMEGGKVRKGGNRTSLVLCSQGRNRKSVDDGRMKGMGGSHSEHFCIDGGGLGATTKNPSQSTLHLHMHISSSPLLSSHSMASHGLVQQAASAHTPT